MERFQVKGTTDEHFENTTTNVKQMISLLVCAENCSKFLGSLAEMADLFLKRNGRGLPEVAPTRKWHGNSWRIGLDSRQWSTSKGFTMPNVFYVCEAGCSQIPTFRDRTVGNDQDEGSFEETSQNTPENVEKACLNAGYIGRCNLVTTSEPSLSLRL